MSASQARTKRAPQEIGWREHVGLPDLGIVSLRAKIDTGARTSAINATDLEAFERRGIRWATFIIPILGHGKGVRCEVQVIDQRKIKNTGGDEESRQIIQTEIILGRRQWLIEVSLTNREHMEYDLILGRTAIRRRRLLVNPGRSFLAGYPDKKKHAAVSLN